MDTTLTAAAIGVGGTVIVGVAGFWASVRNTNKNTALALRAVELTEQGQVADRYTRAIEQLGSKTIDVTIGGIYALERIVHDSPGDHPTIMEVLAACIREHSCEQWPEPSEEQGAKSAERATRPDIQAALTVIGRRDATQDQQPIDLAGANLTRANLSGAKLAGAHIAGANFTDADLTQADLTEATLINAFLTRVMFGLDPESTTLQEERARAIVRGELSAPRLTIFNEAHLSEAMLTRARLPGAAFMKARLIGANLADAFLNTAILIDANLTEADLTEADLTFADLTGANLTRARLPGAVLVNARLIGANLADADLADADLTRANLTDANLDHANLTGADLGGAFWPRDAAAPGRLETRRLGQASGGRHWANSAELVRWPHTFTGC